MDTIENVRAAVADALERRGHGNLQFIREIREGRRDDGPFMIGALAWAKVASLAPAE
jgi:hypothetical protein